MAFRSLVPHRPARATRPLWGFGDLFEEAWRDFGGLAAASDSDFTPRVDIEDTGDEVRVTAELPGVEEKDVQVTLEDGVLTIQGEKRTERDEGSEGYRLVERRSGSFRRGFRIPWEIDPEAVKASYKHGVLQVSIPKPVDTRPEPRSIPVHTA